MASGWPRGGDYSGTVPYKSREGLTTRPVASSDEIQLRIDPIHEELNEESTGIGKQVRQPRNVTQEIESDAKFRNAFIDRLKMTLIKAQASVKKNLRILKWAIVEECSSLTIHVILCALLCFLIVYICAKFFLR